MKIGLYILYINGAFLIKKNINGAFTSKHILDEVEQKFEKVHFQTSWKIR